MQIQQKKRLLMVAGVAVLILLAVRAFMPLWAKNYINATLKNLEGYDGHVEDVDFALWRGGLALDNLVIVKENSGPQRKAVPFLEVPRFSVKILWPALFRGDLVGSVDVYEPRVFFPAESEKLLEKDAKRLAKDAKKVEAKVDDMVNIIPVRMDSFEIHDGRFIFQKLDSKPPLKLTMSDIHAEARNLTNSKRLSDSLVAKFRMHARAMGHANFSMHMAMNPLARPVSFDVEARLLGLQAKTLNPLTKEYGKFDFEKGSFDVVAEAKVRKGLVNGYVKPLLHDIEIHSDKDRKRDNDNFFQRMWERMLGGAEEVLENQPIAQSGTRIEIKGKLDDPNVDVWRASVEVLRNAFVKALVPEYEPGPSAPVAH